MNIVSTVIFLALVLACPLMMVFMMRGGHGHGHGGHTDQNANGREAGKGAKPTTEELREQFDAIERQLAEREADEKATAGGWR